MKENVDLTAVQKKIETCKQLEIGLLYLPFDNDREGIMLGISKENGENKNNQRVFVLGYMGRIVL